MRRDVPGPGEVAGAVGEGAAGSQKVQAGWERGHRRLFSRRGFEKSRHATALGRGQISAQVSL